jgi:phosphoserine phosphatase
MLPRLLLGPHRALPAAPLPRRAMPSSSAAAPERRRPLRGVVFDMDGTLTVPAIDFQAMHREVLGGDAAYAAARAAGGGSVDILHCIESWAPHLQRRAYDVIARFEREGLDRLQIMPGERPASPARGFLSVLFVHNFVRLAFFCYAGASELCGFLDAKNIRLALVTSKMLSGTNHGDLNRLPLCYGLYAV